MQGSKVNSCLENFGNFPSCAILTHSYQRELMSNFQSDIVTVAVKLPPSFCRTGFSVLSHEIETAVYGFDLQDA